MTTRSTELFDTETAYRMASEPNEWNEVAFEGAHIADYYLHLLRKEVDNSYTWGEAETIDPDFDDLF